MPKVSRRLRPRVRSCTFHRLRWLLLREAAVLVVNPARSEKLEGPVRSSLVGMRDREVRALVEGMLARDPSRRVWPPQLPAVRS